MLSLNKQKTRNLSGRQKGADLRPLIPALYVVAPLATIGVVIGLLLITTVLLDPAGRLPKVGIIVMSLAAWTLYSKQGKIRRARQPEAE